VFWSVRSVTTASEKRFDLSPGHVTADMDELVDATDGNHTESYFGRTGTRGVFLNANTLASEDSSSVARGSSLQKLT
jgi:hypothetical protein